MRSLSVCVSEDTLLLGLDFLRHSLDFLGISIGIQNQISVAHCVA